MSIAKSSLWVTGIFITSLTLAQTGSTPAMSPNALVQTVVANELKQSESDPSRWMYELTQVENGQNQTKQVVEMRDGSLDRLIAINGQSLSVQKQSEETDRINKLVHHPQEQEKLNQQQRKNAAQCTALMKMMPEAFIFSYAGQEGDLVRLAFTPDPAFHSSSWEGRVLHAVAGTVLIHLGDQRLAAISGRLIEDVKFGGGFLGHLSSGGHFNIQRTNIGHGHWEITSLQVNMNGKALLFKSIAIQRNESKANFKRVSDNLSPQAAAEELNSGTVLARGKIEQHLTHLFSVYDQSSLQILITALNRPAD